MYKYFLGVVSQDAAKTKYRELAKVHHPDRGGIMATFQEIQAEYDKIKAGNVSFPVSNAYNDITSRGPNSAEAFGEYMRQAKEATAKAMRDWAKVKDGMKLDADDLFWWDEIKKDTTYDIIDDLIDIIITEKKTTAWLVFELTKLTDLAFTHFKFIRYRLAKRNPDSPKLSDEWLSRTYGNYIAVKRTQTI